jgi:hypothetical protein
MLRVAVLSVNGTNTSVEDYHSNNMLIHNVLGLLLITLSYNSYLLGINYDNKYNTYNHGQYDILFAIVMALIVAIILVIQYGPSVRSVGMGLLIVAIILVIQYGPSVRSVGMGLLIVALLGETSLFMVFHIFQFNSFFIGYLTIQIRKQFEGLNLGDKITRLLDDSNVRIFLVPHSQGRDIVMEAISRLNTEKLGRISIANFAHEEIPCNAAREVVNFIQIGDLIPKIASMRPTSIRNIGQCQDCTWKVPGSDHSLSSYIKRENIQDKMRNMYHNLRLY